MSFVDDLAGDAAAIVAEQGIPGTYKSLGVAPGTAITLIFDPSDQDPETARDGRQEIRRGVVQTLPSDTTSPDVKDLFTIATIEWAVETVRVGEWIVEWNVVRHVQQRHGGAEGYVER